VEYGANTEPSEVIAQNDHVYASMFHIIAAEWFDFVVTQVPAAKQHAVFFRVCSEDGSTL
jgi:hypothetical protein